MVAASPHSLILDTLRDRALTAQSSLKPIRLCENFITRCSNIIAPPFVYISSSRDIPLPTPRTPGSGAIAMNTIMEKAVSLFIAVAISGTAFNTLIV